MILCINSVICSNVKKRQIILQQNLKFLKHLNKIVNLFNFAAEYFYSLCGNYIMSVSIGKKPIDKIAMLVMSGIVVAFLVGFLVAVTSQN